MTVTLTNSTVTFTFNDGEIDTVNSHISANLDYDSMPLSVAQDAMLYDFNGVTKTISIRGKLLNDGTNHLSSGTAITIDAQRQWLEKILDGFQSGTTFASNYSNSWTGSAWANSVVLLSTLIFNEETGNPNSLPFELIMLVGSV